MTSTEGEGPRSIDCEMTGTVSGALVQAGVVHNGVHLHARTWSPAIPRQLRGVTRQFVGRKDELDTLSDLLRPLPAAPTAMIGVIVGPAGVGKTTLAVHWAHQVADHFPDGQLYVDLRGFDPSGSVMTPEEAVRGFLGGLGVPVREIPQDVHDQVKLYRSLVANRKILVILDNAHDTSQVFELLPAGRNCVAVITSRNTLPGVIATMCPCHIKLDLLAANDARELLVGHLGNDRVEAEPRATSSIIKFCAGLPLALSIVATRAVIDPDFSLAVIAEELADADGLDALDIGAPDARTAFSWSYKHLSPPSSRMFRLLASHPGPEISRLAAASLAGVSPQQARWALAELTRSHLVDEPKPGRYKFHDLLRAYAREQTQSLDSEGERQTAIWRLVDHYHYNAHVAATLVRPRKDPLWLAGPEPTTVQEALTTPDKARSWFEIESSVLLAVVQAAYEHGLDSQAWQLPWAMTQFYECSGRWHDWCRSHEIALRAAGRSGDRKGEAHVRQGLGRALPWLGHHEEAYDHLRQALGLFAEQEDLSSQARTRLDLCWLLGHDDHYEKAIPHADTAFGMARAADDPLTGARALNFMGWYRAIVGDGLNQALAYCQQSLELHRRFKDQRGEAFSLHNIGYCYHKMGEYGRAVEHYEAAVRLLQKLGDLYTKACTLTRIGDTRQAAGDHHAARTAWRDSLGILKLLKTSQAPSEAFPNVNQVQARLDELACRQVSSTDK